MLFLNMPPQRLDAGATPTFVGLIIGSGGGGLISSAAFPNSQLDIYNNAITLQAGAGMDFKVSGGTQAMRIAATTGRVLIGTTTDNGATLQVEGTAAFAGTIKPQNATTAGAPAYAKGTIYFDTTLNKLRVGGATAWETITSV